MAVQDWRSGKDTKCLSMARVIDVRPPKLANVVEIRRYVEQEREREP